MEAREATQENSHGAINYPQGINDHTPFFPEPVAVRSSDWRRYYECNDDNYGVFK